jgi:hypothetical protein
MTKTKTLFTVLASLQLCACGTAVKETRSFGQVPSWYLKPSEGTAKDEVPGVGTYRAVDLDFARSQAVMNARADLVATIRSKVEQALRNTYSEVARLGMDKDLPPVDRVAELFRQSLSSDTLICAEVSEAFVGDDGQVFARVILSKESAMKSARETMRAAVIAGMRDHAEVVEQQFREQLDVLPWNQR